MLAKVLRWGNGFGLKVLKKDSEAAGVLEGDIVRIQVIPRATGKPLDLPSLPTFEDDDRWASQRHDRRLYR